ncbi:MAG: ABC transporter ATP-binding protein [Trueperaceae bacterium]|nr:ABC transporter ATP-binding protein [Trueperaceae bacterium]
MIALNNIVATYTTVRGQVNAVDNVNVSIPNGNIVGIAGESGCGKSTLLKIIYGDILYPLSLSQGSINYGIEGKNGEISTKDIGQYWFKRISYIPQSSMSSLNPVVRIRKQFLDFLEPGQNKKAILEQVREYIKGLDLPPEALDSYPHQLSGGMRQRIMVALGTYFKPDIILADEPTTALDVVVQKGILLLLMEIQEQMKNTILFVSHDMGVHYQISHKMLIMYAAKVVEFGDSEAVFKAPMHPYTRMLIEALPTIGDAKEREGVSGRPPSLWDKLVGCRFAARCPFATEVCKTEEPEFLEHQPGHFAACHHVDRVRQA